MSPVGEVFHHIGCSVKSEVPRDEDCRGKMGANNARHRKEAII